MSPSCAATISLTTYKPSPKFCVLAAVRSVTGRIANRFTGSKNIIRLFPKETGMRLGRWQMQARLMKAFELFDQGHSITYVALELGYSRRG